MASGVVGPRTERVLRGVESGARDDERRGAPRAEVGVAGPSVEGVWWGWNQGARGPQ